MFGWSHAIHAIRAPSGLIRGCARKRDPETTLVIAPEASSGTSTRSRSTSCGPSPVCVSRTASTDSPAGTSPPNATPGASGGQRDRLGARPVEPVEASVAEVREHDRAVDRGPGAAAVLVHRGPHVPGRGQHRLRRVRRPGGAAPRGAPRRSARPTRPRRRRSGRSRERGCRRRRTRRRAASATPRSGAVVTMRPRYGRVRACRGAVRGVACPNRTPVRVEEGRMSGIAVGTDQDADLVTGSRGRPAAAALASAHLPGHGRADTARGRARARADPPAPRARLALPGHLRARRRDARLRRGRARCGLARAQDVRVTARRPAGPRPHAYPDRMRSGLRRMPAVALVVGLIAIAVGFGPAAARADDPTWAQVQAAKHDVKKKAAAVAAIESALDGLEAQAARLGTVALEKAALASAAADAAGGRAARLRRARAADHDRGRQGGQPRDGPRRPSRPSCTAAATRT